MKQRLNGIALVVALLLAFAAVLLWPSAGIAQEAQQLGVVILEMPYDPGSDTYILRFSVTNPELVHQVIVRVVDGNGTDVSRYSVRLNQARTAEVRIDGSVFVPGGSYTILIQAQDLAGNLMERPGGNNSGSLAERLILEEREFTHRVDSAPMEFAIESANPIFDSNLLVIDLDVPSGSPVASYDLFIINKSGQKLLEVGPEPFTGTRLEAPLPVAMQRGGVADEYALTVNLTAPDSVRAKAEFDFQVQPPPPPKLFERISDALAANPIIAVAIVAVLGGAATAAILFRKRQSYRLPAGRPPPIDRTAALKPVSLPTEPPPPQPTAEARPVTVRVRVMQTPGASEVPDGAISSFPVKIGRANHDINLPGDQSVSRSHAELTMHDGIVYIVDTGSTNGTYLEGKRLEKLVPAPLNHTNRVQLGSNTVLELEVES